MELDFSPEFEAQLASHKVVTTPRGRWGQEERRPRSLSAPRTHQRAQDLVQSLYDRMGVGYQMGQGTEFPAGPVTENVRATYSQAHLVRSAASSSSSYGGRVVPPVETPSNSHTIFQTRGPETFSANDEQGEIQQSRSFHERYKAATSGRADEPPERPRSLSRGRVAHLWPPRNENSAAAVTHQAPAPNGKMHSPNRTSSLNQGSWMEASENTISRKYTRSFEAEEKKEDQVNDGEETPVSLKDRISVFGAVKGSNTKKTKQRTTRSVDPKYLAQFAVRDLPPKIDIYAENNGGAKDASKTTDTTEGSTATSPTPEAPKAPPAATKKAGNIAQVYMSAIQAPAVPTKSPKLPASPGRSAIPPREIDLGLVPNDSQSLTGVSTVSGDDFTNGKPGRIRPSWRKSAPSAPLLSAPAQDDDTVQRLVEIRVKERMSDLESKMESRLRQLVGSMEARVMQRLDVIERKMTQNM